MNARLTALGAGLGLLGAAGLGVWLGLPAGLLALAGLVLVFVLTGLWQSLAELGGQGELDLEAALALGAPAAAEEQKRAVLRALRDLEYELRVGKIDAADYAAASAYYRAEAARMIAASDAALAGQREAAEQRLSEYLAAHPLPAVAARKPASEPVAESATPAEPTPVAGSAAAPEPVEDRPTQESL
jgi:hypothetical protein